MTSVIKNPVIPVQQQFYGIKDKLNRKAICAFAATGFFLDRDTYYDGLKVVPAGTTYTEDQGEIIPGKPWFKWHYDPKSRSLDDVTEEFKFLFEGIIAGQVHYNPVILPLSGGLDSRTQAAALRNLGVPVSAYSYQYANGINETKYASKIAQVCGFNFKQLLVPEGYLLPIIQEVGQINGCYTEFTTPRQFAFLSTFRQMEGVFSLGHWGDVLFDSPSIESNASELEMVQYITRLICKKGGPEFARALWLAWNIEGDFDDYLKERITSMLRQIDVSDGKSKVRAFKSLYWAPRWTSINLSAFSLNHEISLPYYDEHLCRFICGIPESMLASRQIQINYLKRFAPDLAKIAWQDHRPFNLYNYTYDRLPFNLLHRVTDKLRRTLSSNSFTLRNWELQFIGKSNNKLLYEWISNPTFREFVPASLSESLFNEFSTNPNVRSAHAVSMLLTLAVFQGIEQPALK